MFEVRVPAVGESVQEGEIYKWHKAEGDIVAVDEVLVELETDKATVEIVSEAAGRLLIIAKEGDTVNVGDMLANIDTSVSAEVAGGTKLPDPPSRGSQADEKVLSPAALRVAVQNNVDLGAIEGTGRGGRLTKQDVSNVSKAVPSAANNPVVRTPTMDSSVLATDPSGARDVPVSEGSDTLIKSPAVAGGRNTSREKMSRLRQKIAERLVKAQQTAAMLTTFNEVDMSAVMDIRKSYKESFKEAHGVGLGFMSFFVKATVAALEAVPAINGYIDGSDIVLHDYMDIGVAVSTKKGLMVPVVRNCEKLNFAQVESSIMHYAKLGRDGKIGVDDLAGGTFTISNGGVFGSLMSTPILNPPQSGILGMHKIQQRPVVVDGKVEVRPMMYLALSYDHRIVDGKEAVTFLVKIKEMIEDPARLLLGV